MELDPTKRYSTLGDLSNHLYALYTMTEDHSDLERALSLSREALELCPVDDSQSIKRQMALCLKARFEWSGQAEDLEEALKIQRELVALTEGKARHHSQDVINLVDSLHSQWDRDPGQLSAFDEGMKQLRDVLRNVGQGPDRLHLLEKLATSTLDRYLQSDAHEDLEEAIACHRELMELTPRGHIRYAKHLSLLAVALHHRFGLFGRMEDIDNAVDSAREAVAIVRSSHRRHDLVHCLSTLGLCLQLRFSSNLHQLASIEDAIAVRREVVSLSHPNDWTALRNLAMSIHSRQRRLQKPDGFEEAIILFRKSLTLIPAGHPDKLLSMGAFAAAALSRCYLGGDIEYQEEALEICRENVALYDPSWAPSSMHYCLALGKLAEAYCIHDEYEEAFTRFEEAVNLRYVPPRHRFDAATLWANMARHIGHSSSLCAHMKALELLDLCLTSTPTIDLQHQFLIQNNHTHSALATNAASCAIEKGELEIAVQVLEQGRAFLWSRIRGYRPSIEKLQERNPSLAEEFKAVCQQLENLTVSSQPDILGMSPIPIYTTPHAAVGLGFDAKMTRNRQLLDDYERIISEIRELNGFSSFLKATPFSTLQTAASGGPVILVNVNTHCSDAIILRATETPLLVPLPGNLSAVVEILATRLMVVDRINRNED
ncbi:hypothetical protein PHLCEN_2v5370 [Hermanssonia centrifuga]|uniref:Uncharacterized protein n=1 Tax=Hermanssonia centrifuga TaxID=98765 RepID=A0A2R6P5C9_9APHY|nr:hypothetical protein PHLCEN_2v5370 [Hermanssonia centrifuga]